MVNKTKRTESVRTFINDHMSLESAKKECERLYKHHRGDINSYANSPLFIVTSLVWEDNKHIPYINERMLEASLIMLEGIVKGYDAGVAKSILFFEYLYSYLALMKSDKRPDCTLNGVLCLSDTAKQNDLTVVYKTVATTMEHFLEQMLKQRPDVVVTADTMNIKFSLDQWRVDETFDCYVNTALIDNGYMLSIYGHVALQMLERLDMGKLENATSTAVKDAVVSKLETIAMFYN